MTKSVKQQHLLALLQQQKTPLKLAELLELLGPDFKERSVRRWLVEMVKAGVIQRQGQKRSTQYWATTPASISTPVEIESQQPSSSVEQPSHAQEIFEFHSQRALQYIQQPLFKRDPVAYDASWLSAYQPNQSFYLTAYRRAQLAEAGARSAARQPAGTYAHKIYHRLLIDLSYNSSRLEGNTYSLLDTEKLIFEGVALTGKLDTEKVMILNHKEAIRYLVDHIQQITFDIHEIFTLHYLLADGLVPSQFAGAIRNHGVRVGGSTYVPLENAQALLLNLQQICQKTALIQDPYEQSFFALTHLAYLQAFTDVNKRTSRLSANIPLLKNNLVPLSFNDVAKEDYSSAMLAVYELKDLNPLIDLYTFSYLRTCQQYDATVEAFGFDELRVLYRQQRRAALRYIITQKLTGDALEGYITHDAVSQIPTVHQETFIEDLREDLKELSFPRIAGLGITAEQLEQWLKLQDQGKKGRS